MSTTESEVFIGYCTIEEKEEGGTALTIRIHLFQNWFFRIILVGFDALFLLPAALALIGDPVRGLPVILVNLAVWMYFCGRDVCWVLFGQEIITVHPNLLTYRKSYGLFHSKLHTWHLPTEFNIISMPGNLDLGPFEHLVFCTLDEKGNPHELIFHSMIALHPCEVSVIRLMVMRFFMPSLFRQLSLN